METNVIYNKSSVSMPEIDDNSIDCIVTSCPYWGLRDYGQEANQIWGAAPNCEHQWGDKLVVRERGSVSGPTAQVGNQQNPEIAKTHSTGGQFCQLCGAWYGQLGLEPTLEMYLEHLLLITLECKRVLKPTGVMWWNHGDCYSAKRWSDSPSTTGISRKCSDIVVEKIHGLPDKCMVLQNYRLILKMIDEQGWILRNDIKWHKPNAMPSSVKDRLANKYEPVFMLTKEKKYWFDLDAIREKHKQETINRKDNWGRDKKPAIKDNMAYQMNRVYLNPSGKNPGDVWTIPTQPYPEAHFATFPEKLIIRPILSSCPEWICKKCGKARVRITKKDNPDHTGKTDSEYKIGQNANRLALLRQAARERGEEFVNKIITIGWTDCGCNAGWRPGIALDPMCGSGTTLAVAKKKNRQFIGYEIVKSYIPLIKKKLAKEDTMFNRDLKEQFL